MKKQMKSVFKAWLLAFLMLPVLTFVSCSDTDDGSYEAPITQVEKISGRWLLSSINQIDESTNVSKDITSLFSFITFGIDFNPDGTFVVSGSAPALLPVSGTWTVLNQYVASDGSANEISLNGSDGTTARVTVTATPSSADGSASHLKYRLTRKANGTAFVSYEYDLEPMFVYPEE